jgi:predicted nucleic acid-binding protein
VIRTVIADTSAIVSLLSTKDRWFDWAGEQFGNFPKPFITCEAVVSEACFLMRRSYQGQEDVLNWVADGILRIDFSLAAEIETVLSRMKKYENVPMSLADACLVRMCEMEKDSAIFTLDSDFRIYRKNGRSAIPLIVPNTI